MIERDIFDELIEQGLSPVGPPITVVIVDIEPEARPLKAKWKVEFHKVQSERFVKENLELKPYELPISEILIANSVKDIAAAEDARFAALFAKG